MNLVNISPSLLIVYGKEPYCYTEIRISFPTLNMNHLLKPFIPNFKKNIKIVLFLHIVCNVIQDGVPSILDKIEIKLIIK